MNTLDAVRFFGSKAAVARALGISQVAVTRWGEVIPEGRSLKIEKLTNSELKYDAAFYPKGRRRAKHPA